MNAGIMRFGFVACLCLALPIGGVARAAAGADQDRPSLLAVWFALQASGPIYPPYAYIRHRDTQAAQTARKQRLLEELDDLVWYLDTAGNAALTQALGQWQDQIRGADDYRSPGHWGAAALLSSPRNGVPLSVVAAVGACQVPNWIEIWSAQGVQRIDWQPRMRLSSLLAHSAVVQQARAQTVTLVTPFGATVDRGIAPWNHQDIPLVPGMRIVVPLPLEGQVAVWLQKTLPAFLAHLLPADKCRQITLKHEAAGGAG
ncbi:MAG: hypothetical protein L0H83_02475 [Salinisphaera sp.]|nr:hypothetical protein [Salinisphaera sp.]